MDRQLTEKQEKRIQKILSLITEGNVAIAKYLFDLEDKIDENIPEIKNLIARLRGDKGEPGKDGRNGVDGKDGKDGRNGVDGKKGLDGRDGKDGRDGIDGKDGLNGEDGLNGKDGSPDTGEQIVEKINDLPTDDDSKKIDAFHIKGLDEVIKKTNSTKGTVGGVMGGRDLIKRYDLSDQLDGVTKTFQTPSHWIIIDVRSDSFPIAFREGVHYTSTSSTITFTDEVEASAALAQGQTLYIIYVVS